MLFIHAIGTQINGANQALQCVESVHTPINLILLLTIIIIVFPGEIAILASHSGRYFDDAMNQSIKMLTKHTTIADVCFCNPSCALIFQKFFNPALTTKIHSLSSSSCKLVNPPNEDRDLNKSPSSSWSASRCMLGENKTLYQLLDELGMHPPRRLIPSLLYLFSLSHITV